MKRLNQTVWCAQDGSTQLLIERQPGKYYVPLPTVDVIGLVELGLAVADALDRAPADPATEAGAPEVLKAWQAMGGRGEPK